MTTTWGGVGLRRSHLEIQQHILKALTHSQRTHRAEGLCGAQTHLSVKESTTVLPLEPRPRLLSLRCEWWSKVAPANPTPWPPQAPTKLSLPIQDLAFSKVLQIPHHLYGLITQKKAHLLNPQDTTGFIPPNPKPRAAGPNDQLTGPLPKFCTLSQARHSPYLEDVLQTR